MIVTILHGQNHHGSSYQIASMLKQMLEPDQTYEFFLPKDLPYFCTGCGQCLNQGMNHCPHASYTASLEKAIQISDLLILTTPTYCFHASSPMKNLLDHFFTYWMVHRPKQENFHKKAVIISTCAGAGAAKAIHDIKTSLNYWGIHELWSLGVRVMASCWEDVPADIKSRIDRRLHTIVHKLQGGEPHPCLWLKTRFLFYMMRSMHKKGMSASTLDHQYWQDHGWLKDQRPWRSL